jgi:hypothetical protein
VRERRRRFGEATMLSSITITTPTPTTTTTTTSTTTTTNTSTASIGGVINSAGISSDTCTQVIQHPSHHGSDGCKHG